MASGIELSNVSNRAWDYLLTTHSLHSKAQNPNSFFKCPLSWRLSESEWDRVRVCPRQAVIRSHPLVHIEQMTWMMTLLPPRTGVNRSHHPGPSRAPRMLRISSYPWNKLRSVPSCGSHKRNPRIWGWQKRPRKEVRMKREMVRSPMIMPRLIQLCQHPIRWKRWNHTSEHDEHKQLRKSS